MAPGKCAGHQGAGLEGRIGSGSAGELTAAAPGRGAGTTWTDAAGFGPVSGRCCARGEPARCPLGHPRARHSEARAPGPPTCGSVVSYRWSARLSGEGRLTGPLPVREGSSATQGAPSSCGRRQEARACRIRTGGRSQQGDRPASALLAGRAHRRGARPGRRWRRAGRSRRRWRCCGAAARGGRGRVRRAVGHVSPLS